MKILQKFRNALSASSKRKNSTAAEQAAHALQPIDLFDRGWYEKQATDLQGLDDPLAHYLEKGGFEGLKPCALFDSQWYLEHYPDVLASGMNPLLHYTSFGASEQRSPCALFDAQWYSLQYPDLIAAKVNLLNHFIKFGSAEGRNPNAYFDTAWYLQRYKAARESALNPLVHYMLEGEPLGYHPSERFDPTWYKLSNPDLPPHLESSLQHFLDYGLTEGRRPIQGPGDFCDERTLRKHLSEVPPTKDGEASTACLPLTSVPELICEAPATGSMILQETQQSAEGVDDIKRYPGLPYVAQLRDVLIIGGVRYMISNNHIVHDEMYAYRDEPAAAVKYYGARLLRDHSAYLQFKLRPAAWIDDGIHVMHEYSNNYFHFVAETFPRLVLAEEANIDRKIPFIFEGNLHPNMLDLIRMVNTSNRPTTFIESGTLYHAKNLYFPSDITSVVDAYYGGPVSRQSFLDIPRIREAVDRCKACFPHSDNVRKRRIYAGRGGKTRVLKNQAEIEARLAGLGFEIIRTEDLNIETQISIFREAEIIIAPTGAQLTNLVWCDEDTKVIVLASDHPSHQLYLWEVLGRVSKADVKIVQGPRAYKIDGKYGVHDDYSIDIEAILAHL